MSHTKKGTVRTYIHLGDVLKECPPVLTPLGASGSSHSPRTRKTGALQNALATWHACSAHLCCSTPPAAIQLHLLARNVPCSRPADMACVRLDFKFHHEHSERRQAPVSFCVAAVLWKPARQLVQHASIEFLKLRCALCSLQHAFFRR